MLCLVHPQVRQDLKIKVRLQELVWISGLRIFTNFGHRVYKGLCFIRVWTFWIIHTSERLPLNYINDKVYILQGVVVIRSYKWVAIRSDNWVVIRSVYSISACEALKDQIVIFSCRKCMIIRSHIFLRPKNRQPKTENSNRVIFLSYFNSLLLSLKWKIFAKGLIPHLCGYKVTLFFELRKWVFIRSSGPFFSAANGSL